MIQSIVNQRVSEANSTIDQNSIAMDFKAFHIITENTQNDEKTTIEQPKYVQSEFVNSKQYQAYKK